MQSEHVIEPTLSVGDQARAALSSKLASFGGIWQGLVKEVRTLVAV